MEEAMTLLEAVLAAPCCTDLLKTHPKNEITEVDAWLQANGFELGTLIYVSAGGRAACAVEHYLKHKTLRCATVKVWGGPANHPYLEVNDARGRVMIKWSGKPLVADMLGVLLGSRLHGLPWRYKDGPV
jgi:hypothetical protein